MSKESYARGFCKAAEAAGIDPKALAKFAQSGPAGTGPLKGNAARQAVQGLYDNGYLTLQETPWTTRIKEMLLSKLPFKAYGQYAANDPGYITTINESGGVRAVKVPSRLHTAQVLGKNTGEMNLNDWGIMDKVQAHRPISAFEHSRMQDAVERANPEMASRHGWETVGKSAPAEHSTEGILGRNAELLEAKKAIQATTAAAKSRALPGKLRVLRVLSHLLRRR